MEEVIQTVLEELTALAGSQEGMVTAAQLREAAEGKGLGSEELLKVLGALRKQRITVEVPLSQDGQARLSMGGSSARRELTGDEREYARKYQEELLSSALPGGMKSCIPGAFALAERYYCDEIGWEDLVQETCFALFASLEDGTQEREVLRRVEEGIVRAISERVSEREADQALIDQVEKLEQAVRELNEGEGEKFTIQELAIILDMDVETIHDILKLTGDDEGQSGEDQSPE